MNKDCNDTKNSAEYKAYMASLELSDFLGLKWRTDLPYIYRRGLLAIADEISYEKFRDLMDAAEKFRELMAE